MLLVRPFDDLKTGGHGPGSRLAHINGMRAVED